MPKPTRERLESILERQAGPNKSLLTEEMDAIARLALLSLTAMEGEGVEVPELDVDEGMCDEPIIWAKQGQLSVAQIAEVIRRNNAEPVLRALVKSLEAELKEATTDQPTMKLLTTVMDERDGALALVKELREGLEVWQEWAERNPKNTTGDAVIFIYDNASKLLAKSKGVK